MSRDKLFAWFAVSLMICVPLVGVNALDEDDESDALIPLIVALPLALAGETVSVEAFIGSVMLWIGVSFAAGAATGGLLVYELMDSTDPDVWPYLRLMVARELSSGMDAAVKFTRNAGLNYSQIWSMTKEHWVRQAELEAYTEWGADSDYNANRILERSQIFRNAAVMNANAVAQFNLYADAQSEVTKDWNRLATYQDNMEIRFSTERDFFSTGSGNWDADLVSVADARGGLGYVYIGYVQDSEILTEEDYEPSYLYASKQTVLTGDGRSYTLGAGTTMLSDLADSSGKGFQPGIYKVSDALIAGDTLAGVSGGNALTLRPGLVMDCDGNKNVAFLDGSGKISCNNAVSDTLEFRIIPSATPTGPGTEKPEAINLKKMLESYGSLLKTMEWTTVSAENSARAVWDIYDECASKNYTVTTLMNSDNFDGYFLSSGMKEALTLSAMSQLASYYGEYKDHLDELYIGLYRSGEVSNTFFVKGSISDGFGHVLYDDVIYTPFFQSKNAVLTDGTDFEVNQNTIIMIWDHADGRTLTQWYDEIVSEGTVYYESLMAENGYTLGISELAECGEDGMQTKDKIELSVTQVNFINPEKVKFQPSPDPEPKGTNWILVICLILGIICLAYGLIARNPVYIIVGIGILIFGIVFGQAAMDWLGKLNLFGGPR